MRYIEVFCTDMPTSPRSTYHHGDLRSKLLVLARAAIEEDGPEAVALRGLAAKAGVSPMAPYRHFADKAALFEAVAREGFAELHAELAAVADDADPVQALVAFGRVYVGFACARPGLFRLMFGATPTASNGPADDPASILRPFEARLAQLLPPPEQQAALLACWSLVHGLASLYICGRIRETAPPPPRLAEHLSELLMKGLLA